MNKQRPSLARQGAPGPAGGRDPSADKVSWLLALKRNGRVKTMAVGYLVVGVFGLVAVVARWGFAVPPSAALLAGVIAAAPIIIAFVGERITGFKAFSVEISLAQITVPVVADLTQVVMQTAPMDIDSILGLQTTLVDAVRKQASLLRINLRADDYWWSTRLYLAAAVTADYTKVEQLVFVRGQEEMLWLGMIDPATTRERLSEQFPKYEEYYRAVRSEIFATRDVSATPDRDNEIGQVFIGWPGKFSWQEGQTKQIVTSDLLRHWLGADLDTEALPYGPLVPLLQYRVIQRPHRYTALVADGRLKAVIDKSELATRTTDALLRHELS